MDDFNHKWISSIHITEEISLRINILKNKCKQEVATTSQVMDKVDRAHEQANKIVAIIVEDANPAAERKSKQFA